MTNKDKGFAQHHMPDSSVLDKVEQELEKNLPEDYKLEKVQGHVHPPKQTEDSNNAVGLDILLNTMRREEDETYFITDPSGHEAAEIGFNVDEVGGKEKVVRYRFDQAHNNTFSGVDQTYLRMERFADENLENMLESAMPERPFPKEEIDRIVMLNYKGESGSLDKAETEQFQKAVSVLEKTDRAHIDPEYADRDAFYSQESYDPGHMAGSGGAIVATNDYQELLNFMRDTELYVEDSKEI